MQMRDPFFPHARETCCRPVTLQSESERASAANIKNDNENRKAKHSAKETARNPSGKNNQHQPTTETAVVRPRAMARATTVS